jgi:NADH dehydrogenase
VIVDVAPRVLGAFPEDLSADAKRRLEKIQVEVWTGTKVVSLDARSVTLQTGDKTEVIATDTVLWAAGVEASPLGRRLCESLRCEPARGGRVPVSPELNIAGHQEVYVIGDLAHSLDSAGHPLPGVAPVAIQQGKYVANTILRRLRNRPVIAFQYRDCGNMATIGRSAAVAQIGRWKFRGRIAWLLWLFIHLIQLVRFESRILVMIQWSWNYFTFNRSARLITEVGHDSTRKPSSNA